ncbi:MAG: PLDc N-terminal domain-containing protein [Bacteroidota bacterium]
MTFFFLVGVAFLTLIIYTAVKLWERTDIEDNTKLLWTILIVVAPVIGLICYYVFGRQPGRI